MAPQNDPVAAGGGVAALSKAIAKAEGGVDNGSNNPGSLALGDKGAGLFNSAGVTKFPTLEDGWGALTNQLSMISDGKSKHFSPDMTLADFAKTWTGGDNADQWAKTVADELGLSPEDNLRAALSLVQNPQSEGTDTADQTAPTSEYNDVKIDLSKSTPIAPAGASPAASDFSGVKLDLSKSIPISGTAKPAAKTPDVLDRFAQVTTGSQNIGQDLKDTGKQILDHPIGSLVEGTKQLATGLGSFAKNLMFHPIDTLTQLTGGPEFSEDYARKNYGGMAGDFAGGLTNALMLADSVKSIPGALKNAGKELAPALREKVGLKISAADAAKPPVGGSFQPALAKTTEEVAKHAAAEGIDMTPSQVTQAPAAKNLQAVGERSLAGGKNLTDSINENRIKLFDSYNEMIRRADPDMKGTTPAAAGEDLAEQISAKKEAAHDAAKSGYRAITELKEVPVNVSDIQKKWMANRQEMQTVLDNAPETVKNQLKSVLNLGSDMGTEVKVPMSGGDTLPVRMAQLSFDDAMQLRSFYREMGETQIAELPSRFQGMFKELSGDVDTAMGKAAGESGMEDLWRQANKGWREYVQKYGDKGSPLNRALASAPEKIASDIIARKNPVDIEALNDEGVDLSGVKQQVLSDIAKRGFRVDRQGLGGYPHAFLRTLLGPTTTDELYLKSEIARRQGINVNPSGTSNVELTIDQLVGPKKAAMSYGGAKVSRPRDPNSVITPPVKPTPGPSGVGAAVASAAPKVAEAELLSKASQPQNTPAINKDGDQQ